MAEKWMGDKKEGSLAARVAWISILFLVVPLLIFSFVGYKMVYNSQLRHILVTMEMLEQGERGVIEEFVKGQDQVLDVMAKNFGTDPITSEELGSYHELISEHEESQNIFFIQKGICKAASNTAFVGKDFTGFLMNRTRLKGGHDLFTSPQFFNRGATLLLAKAMPQGYLMISFPLDRLLRAHSIVDDEDYPVNFSLLNQFGEELGSTNPIFGELVFAEGGVQMEMIDWQKVPRIKQEIDAFRFTLDGKKWAGIIKPVEDTGYQLLFAIGSDFAFFSFDHFIRMLIFFFGALMLIGFPLAYLFTKRFSKPLKDLSEVMTLVGKGKTHYRYEPDSYGFEINHAGLIFNEMIDTLLHAQREGEEQRVANQTLSKELEIGQEVQQSLIPQTLPEISGLQMVARYLPAKEVSGDFYDLFQREDGKWLIVMADISGKGIHACFYALLLRSMLRSFASKNADLAEIVQQTNKLFALDTAPHGVFATVWLGIFDPTSFSLTHLNCGHPSAYILRTGDKIEELNNRAISLGVTELTDLPIQTTELQPGDQLFIFTDGLSEMHNLKNGLFGEERIKEFLIQKSDLSFEDFIADLFEELAWFSEGAPQHDDLSFLLIRRASERSPEVVPQSDPNPLETH
ncbi:MAG: SpoIIE family protein phosphatase [Candidatus Algichlamydia australiensis]|nr:SpoIIE family protein phosphatase [Chlamydiales bacterium]